MKMGPVTLSSLHQIVIMRKIGKNGDDLYRVVTYQGDYLSRVVLYLTFSVFSLDYHFACVVAGT